MNGSFHSRFLSLVAKSIPLVMLSIGSRAKRFFVPIFISSFTNVDVNLIIGIQR